MVKRKTFRSPLDARRSARSVSRVTTSSRVHRILLSASGTLALAACSDTAPLPIEAVAQVAVVSGADQSGIVSEPLAEPIRVIVTDAAGTSVFGVNVRFHTTIGGGEFSPEVVATDPDGAAESSWVLGQNAGTQASRVTVLDTEVRSETIEAAALAGAPFRLTGVRNLGQTAAVGQPIPDPPLVRVSDFPGNSVSGFPIAWRLTASGGSLSADTTFTNGEGVATIQWTIGTSTTPPVDTVFAEVAGLTGSPITITVLKQAGPATDATADSGAAQTGAPAETLPAALVVLIEDQYGNGVFGMGIHHSRTSWLRK